jgi:hypothetical protein
LPAEKSIWFSTASIKCNVKNSIQELQFYMALVLPRMVTNLGKRDPVWKELPVNRVSLLQEPEILKFFVDACPVSRSPFDRLADNPEDYPLSVFSQQMLSSALVTGLTMDLSRSAP